MKTLGATTANDNDKNFHDAAFPTTPSEFAEQMEIYITSSPISGKDKNYYKVVIHTGYRGKNASDTDEIMDGYSYTQVLEVVKDFEANNNSTDTNLSQYLNQNIPGTDDAWAHVVSADRISKKNFKDSVSSGEPGIREGGTRDLSMIVSIDSAYGYFGLEHLEKQSITFQVDFSPRKKLGIDEQEKLHSLSCKLVDEAFGYGSNGRAQLDWYLADALSELERFPDANEHMKQAGMDSPRTIEYMNKRLLRMLTNEDINFIRESLRAERARNLISQIKEGLRGVNLVDVFNNVQISGKKNPRYLEYESDTLNVIVSMIPNDPNRIYANSQLLE